MTVPGADVAQRPTGIGWYRCWVKVPDNWATLGGRDLWVESVTLTIDSSHTAHEAYLNGKRLGGAGTFPPDATAGDGFLRLSQSVGQEWHDMRAEQSALSMRTAP